MICKRFVLIMLCLLIAISSYGCFGLLLTALGDELADESDISEVVVHEPIELEDKTSQESEDEEQYDNDIDYTDEIESEIFPNTYELDMSSAEAFIADVEYTYEVKLLDKFGFLSGSSGDSMMRELDKALSIFTPKFVRALVTEYKEYGSSFTISLEDYSSTEYGMTSWDEDLTISLHYDSDPEECGITAAVLAHELAHAAHFIIEEHIGETRSMLELRFFNGVHGYVEDDYEYVWIPDVHALYFAYDYGMYDYYEDFATIIELLVAFPGEMVDRLSDHRHEALAKKTTYLRDIMNSHISDSNVFAPLNVAEPSLDTPAA